MKWNFLKRLRREAQGEDGHCARRFRIGTKIVFGLAIAAFAVLIASYGAKSLSQRDIYEPNRLELALLDAEHRLKENPNDWRALFDRATCLYTQGKKEEGMKSFTECLAQAPEMKKSEMALEFAQFLLDPDAYDQEEYARAHDCLELALKYDPRNWDALFSLVQLLEYEAGAKLQNGDIAACQSDISSALSYLEDMGKIRPADKELQELKEEVTDYQESVTRWLRDRDRQSAPPVISPSVES